MLERRPRILSDSRFSPAPIPGFTFRSLLSLTCLLCVAANGQQDATALADQNHSRAPNATHNENWEPQRDEFLAIAQQLFESDDEYMGYGVILEDRILLAKPDLYPAVDCSRTGVNL